MSKKKQVDNWSLLASELGLENTPDTDGTSAGSSLEEVSSPPFPTEPESGEDDSLHDQSVGSAISEVSSTETSSSFGAGLLDDPSPESSSSKPNEGKRTFFGRFPKINLFGNSSKESAHSVAEGPKSPSSPGKSFTSKTLEKVPVSPDRIGRSSRGADKTPRENREKSMEKESTVADIADSLDPWSQIASQVGALSSSDVGRSGKKSAKKDGSKEGSKFQREDGAAKKKGKDEKSRGGDRKSLPSLFDDVDLVESEETVALKRLIEDDPESLDDAAKRLDTLFSEKSDGRGDRRDGSVGDSVAATSERAPKRRDHRGKKDDRRKDSRERFSPPPDPETDDVTPKESAAKEKVRGRRGSRFVEQETAPDDDFDIDVEASTWDIEEESKPVERSPRGDRRRGRKFKDSETPDRSERSGNRETPIDRNEEILSDEFGYANPHKNIPSWDDAIGLIVEANIARHGQRSEPRRGRR